MTRTAQDAITSGEIGPVEKASMVVVYDRQTGVIVHVHHSVTIKGGRHPDKQELTAKALELANRRAARSSELSTLHVDPRRVKFGVHYQVDLRKRALKPVPADLRIPSLPPPRGKRPPGRRA